MSRFEDGQSVTIKELENADIIDRPYNYISNNLEAVLGLVELPAKLFSKEFCFPSVNENNIWEKVECVENILQSHGVDISFNLYQFVETKVHNTYITSEKRISANRTTSSVCMAARSKTLRARNHRTSFNLTLTKSDNGAQLHCALCLTIGKFIYWNHESFLYDKSPEELEKLLNLSPNILIGTKIGDDEKVITGQSRKSKTRAVSWQTCFTCNACQNAFVRKQVFSKHVKSCVGGHISGMTFDPIPHIEHFEEKDFHYTLACPIISSYDTEACSTIDFERRINKKDGTVYKSDGRKIKKMVLSACVATVIIRPEERLIYTIYKDASMNNEELLNVKESTIPKEINRLIDLEDIIELELVVDEFRSSMEEFMDFKLEVLELENRVDNNTSSSRLSVGEKNILLATLKSKKESLRGSRDGASKCFGLYFMQLFQCVMEATQKYVLFNQKKTLNMSARERLDFTKPYYSKVQQLLSSGEIKIHHEQQHQQQQFDKERKLGFVNLTSSNSVREHEGLNCKICNHKLDPLYIRNLNKHLKFKLDNPNYFREAVEDEDDYSEILVDGKVIRVKKSKQKPPAPAQTPSLSSNDRKTLLNMVVHSPHNTIWSGRNMWSCKDEIYRFYCSELNRYKQALLVTVNEVEETCKTTSTTAEQIQNLQRVALSKLEATYSIESAEDFVLSLAGEDWRITEPYTKAEGENLIECLYRFVEMLTSLNQLLKAFDSQSQWVTSALATLSEMVHQKTVETYGDRARQRTDEEVKAKIFKKGGGSEDDGKIMWFFDEQSYIELGESVLRMVELISAHENYVESNYTPQMILERIRSINIVAKAPTSSSPEQYEREVHQRRAEVLRARLLDAFVTIYPNFEYELRYFAVRKRQTLLPKICATYLDMMVIHHHHYFPKWDPLGFAHQACNVRTFTKGMPDSRCYLHNLEGYDFSLYRSINSENGSGSQGEI